MMKEIDAVLQDPKWDPGNSHGTECRAGAFRKEYRSAADSAGQKNGNPSRGTRIQNYMTPPFGTAIAG